MLALSIVCHHIFHFNVISIALRSVQLSDSSQDIPSSNLILEIPISSLTEVIYDLHDFLLVLSLCSILTHDPSDDLHERVRDVRVLLEDLRVNLDSRLSELLTIDLPFVFTDALNKLVRQICRYQVSSYLIQLVHGSYVPVLAGRELLP